VRARVVAECIRRGPLVEAWPPDCLRVSATRRVMTDMLDSQAPPAKGPILPVMATQFQDALTRAALNELERRLIARLVDRLKEKLGGDLLAVWLYGSRARGEADPSETDPDRRCDVDLLAIVTPSRDARELSWWALPMVEEEADAIGESPVYFSLRIFDVSWLRERRVIRDFFVQEVDRDKLVLAGTELEFEENR
jgi:predicted nucleotidyltransferase